jgi:hypothetical protein
MGVVQGTCSSGKSSENNSERAQKREALGTSLSTTGQMHKPFIRANISTKNSLNKTQYMEIIKSRLFWHRSTFLEESSMTRKSKSAR